MNAPSTTSRQVCLGVIVGAKGLKGEVRIKSFTAEPADIAAYGPLASEDGKRRFTVKVAGVHSGAVIARLDGVTDRTAADRLKGVKLYVDRAALPETETGVYYHADLVGLRARLTTGEDLGPVVAVQNFGGGDILEVARPGEKETTMVPFTAAAIAEVNVKAGEIRIVPLPGLFDDGEEEQDEGEEGTETDRKPKGGP
jgi:16S rRNA processing protein RimM